jgi:hypothetical protein
MAGRWSQAEDRVLRKLYPQGAPIREVAEQLQRSEDAVCERRRTLGLPARPRQRPWSDTEDQLLRAATAAGLPASALAGRLGRDSEQVRRRRRSLLGSLLHPRAYTAVEDERIRACWQDGRDIQALARTLGRSLGSIRQRAQKLGLHQPARRRHWQAHEDAAVRDGYELGMSCAQIAGELPGRTASSVAARAAKLGLANYARAWTPREDRLLRAFARDRVELERAAQILTRTPEALRARTRKLGLPPLRSRRCPRTARPWSASEDDHLRLHAGLNPALLAELLARSPEAVVQRLRRLGLRDGCERSPHHPPPARNGLTPGERATIARELGKGGARRQLALAKRLGRRPAEIKALAGLGIARAEREPTQYGDGGHPRPADKKPQVVLVRNGSSQGNLRR